MRAYGRDVARKAARLILWRAALLAALTAATFPVWHGHLIGTLAVTP